MQFLIWQLGFAVLSLCKVFEVRNICADLHLRMKRSASTGPWRRSWDATRRTKSSVCDSYPTRQGWKQMATARRQGLCQAEKQNYLNVKLSVSQVPEECEVVPK